MNQRPFLIPLCGSLVMHGLGIFLLFVTLGSFQEKAPSLQVVWEVVCSSPPQEVAEVKKTQAMQCAERKKQPVRLAAKSRDIALAPTTSTPSVESKGSPKIARKVYRPLPTYPWICRKRGEEGTVKIKVTLSEEGRVLRAAITESSGHARLDEAALKVVKTWILSGGRGDKTVAIAFSLKDEKPMVL